MATRKQAREAVIQVLYAIELGNDNAIKQAKLFLDGQKIRNKQQEFALSLINGVNDNEKLLVKITNVFLKTWNVERLGVIEKNILKLGIYELLKTDTQRAIIINEAIELTKSFNVNDASKLVNGVLDSISKTNLDSIMEMIRNYEESKQNESKKQKKYNINNNMKQRNDSKTLKNMDNRKQDNKIIKKTSKYTNKKISKNKKTNQNNISEVKNTTKTHKIKPEPKGQK